MQNFINKLTEKLKIIKLILSLKDFNLLKKSILNTIEANIYLNTNNNKRTFSVNRGEIYFIDLGYNIGSEMRGPHYCVVLKTYGKTATIIPLSSKKSNMTFRVDLGVIKELARNENDNSYALINQITTVDKSRLKNKFSNKKRFWIKLNSEQLDNIDKEILNFLLKK